MFNESITSNIALIEGSNVVEIDENLKKIRNPQKDKQIEIDNTSTAVSLKPKKNIQK